MKLNAALGHEFPLRVTFAALPKLKLNVPLCFGIMASLKIYSPPISSNIYSLSKRGFADITSVPDINLKSKSLTALSTYTGDSLTNFTNPKSLPKLSALL
ncbi:MAG: hypothetical protein KGM16_15315 [Bacteroidota bacterium]|nr:hypothetical protein [Bacteroidota bacterium]